MAESIKNTQPSAETIDVSHRSGVGHARRAARALCKAIGFNTQQCEEVAIVAAELASNLVKHAHGGKVILQPLKEEERSGLQIETLDSGPGICDLDRAVTDGYSTAGGLGTGLGTVNRLMDELTVESQEDGGAHVLCRRWLHTHVEDHRPCPLSFGVAARPHPMQDVSGDTFVIKQWAETALVGVIDGLGHGPAAQQAALAARDYIERHCEQGLEDIFRGVGYACHSTRGVVMALARFDWGVGHLSLASLGNIEVRVFGTPEPFRSDVRRGIIGVNNQRPAICHHQWDPAYVMVMHSDGLTSHWRWDAFANLADKPASAMAAGLLDALAKDDDDATVLVVRSALK